jgi:cytochrome c5
MKTTYNKLILVVIVLSGVLAGCERSPEDRGWEFAPNMYLPVGYEPYRQTKAHPINPMGLNMREPVAGTIARRNHTTEFSTEEGATRDIMVYNTHRDSLEMSSRVLKNPVPLNEKSLAEGKVLYERYCQHCHGEGGAGDGKVASIYKGVPNYKAEAYLGMTDGHVFHVITHGKGRMWAHGSQIDSEERWKIVHYVHQLQKD